MNKYFKYLAKSLNNSWFMISSKKSLFHVVTPKFQCIYHMLLFTCKKNKNYQTDPKINQNLAWHKLSCPLHIIFFWSQTPLCLPLWIEILIAISKLFGSSKQMVQVVSSVRDNLCESFSIFYLSIHVWKSWYPNKSCDF